MTGDDIFFMQSFDFSPRSVDFFFDGNKVAGGKIDRLFLETTSQGNTENFYFNKTYSAKEYISNYADQN